MYLPGKRLLVASNRLPVAIVNDDGQWKVEPGAGGLITALAPVVRRSRGIWIGWPGCGPDAPAESLLEDYSSQQEFDLKPVILTDEEVQKYYRGFSNQTIWPLFHDLLGYCTFDGEKWNVYVEVNRKFAEVIAEQIEPKSFIWVHDYQLMLVGHFLRKLRVDRQTAFFLHIPFPSRDLFRRLPWRIEILQNLLQYDHLGFQTQHDRRNFIQCVKAFVPGSTVRTYTRESVVSYEGKTIKLGHYPISIDFDEFNEGAKTKEVAEAAWFIHENLPSRKLVLGLDRLDYTKGIPERFLAFERMLEKYPEVHGNISLIQVVVPSRLKVPEYRDLKELLDRHAGRINGRFSKHGWTPIHYMFRRLDRIQLLGHYLACEIALITPLKDGMNLIAKEFCASSVDNNGILILSEFAGASEQLAKGAIIVNPYDFEGTADAIYSAYIMEPEERQRRIKILRAEVRRNDVKRWIEWCLGS
jgi:trehalose 6-phosphate synthase/phosphatase